MKTIKQQEKKPNKSSKKPTQKNLTKVLLSQKCHIHLTLHTKQSPLQHLLFKKIPTHILRTFTHDYRASLSPLSSDKVLGIILSYSWASTVQTPHCFRAKNDRTQHLYMIVTSWVFR
jgi:hypothetical protein